jgi:hypothetical protein
MIVYFLILERISYVASTGIVLVTSVQKIGLNYKGEFVIVSKK